MRIWQPSLGKRPTASRSAWYWLPGLACIAVLGLGSVYAQQPLIPTQTPPAKKHAKAKSPDKPEVEPNYTIPVAPLGFAPPAAYYLGERISQVSLSFLDEDSLLFTFRIPGLISREAPVPGQSPEGEELHSKRHIRALVVEIPSGNVKAEAVWELHDNARYLYSLKGKKFLLRDKNLIQLGDASLHLEPFLRFPGTINSIDLPPDQHLLVANTSELPAREAKSEPKADSRFDASPAAASSVTVAQHSPSDPAAAADPPQPAATQDLLRILRMDTRTVMLFSRVTGAARVPVDGEGYYEALRGKGTSWVVNYQTFQGASLPLAAIDSVCLPTLDVPASGMVLASACLDGGSRRVFALSASAPDLTPAQKEHELAPTLERSKHRLWDVTLPPTRVWPQFAISAEGRRVARSTLDITHPISANSPLDREDIRSQTIQIYDLATGKVPLTVPASPILDAGGNFALSPSGKRVAVLNAGAIQIYELPAAPDLPSFAKP